ncbi:hypothetical protein Goshw_013245 [Gossypium schwendimanii]|uniref:Uncharacterized protein n=1 Tax=Gossypium schwendimanii TaxID=34291 RepID=A0A7J9N655_GOSSC|nr:hypothetical protein [Gossypium schwendimanii]
MDTKTTDPYERKKKKQIFKQMTI